MLPTHNAIVWPVTVLCTFVLPLLVWNEGSLSLEENLVHLWGHHKFGRQQLLIYHNSLTTRGKLPVFHWSDICQFKRGTAIAKIYVGSSFPSKLGQCCAFFPEKKTWTVERKYVCFSPTSGHATCSQSLNQSRAKCCLVIVQKGFYCRKGNDIFVLKLHPPKFQAAHDSIFNGHRCMPQSHHNIKKNLSHNETLWRNPR